VRADDQGRIDSGALADALSEVTPETPVIVVLQAGNLHSGAFDPFPQAITAAHEHGAWVHVDGAFGLFAAASPVTRHLTAGYEQADSWTTDGHKTLNVPYDCGIAIVADKAALRAAMSMGATDYFITDAAGDSCDTVPESSRRARAIPVWALLRALGRQGTAELVDGFCRHAKAFAAGIEAIEGATVENDVVFSQVSASFGSDERTQQVAARLMADGTAWMTGSRWQGKAVLRISVSNWSTTDEDVARSLDALKKAASPAA
jgi:glutamate/tyrosine decarboxylase-like PLP-dependent enzyme